MDFIHCTDDRKKERRKKQRVAERVRVVIE